MIEDPIPLEVLGNSFGSSCDALIVICKELTGVLEEEFLGFDFVSRLWRRARNTVPRSAPPIPSTPHDSSLLYYQPQYRRGFRSTR